MSKRKTLGIFNLVGYIFQSYIDKISHLISLIILETRLAKESLIKMIISLVLLGFLLAATWLSLLTFFYLFFITKMQLNPITSIGIVIMINIIGCAIVYFYILHLKRDFSFPVTRKQLHLKKHEDD